MREWNPVLKDVLKGLVVLAAWITAFPIAFA